MPFLVRPQLAYDGAGRLQTVTETPKNSEVATRTATYTYDNAGNRRKTQGDGSIVLTILELYDKILLR